MLAQEIIRNKRDGHALDAQAIQQFVNGLVDGSWSEGQVAALAMAIFWRGMDRTECVALTHAMMHSGRVMQWPALHGPVLDKHSSGGVGDKVSLALAPMVAACGGYVPMVSGRGLGHTGGTCDKLAAIAGYDASPTPAVFEHTVRTVGCAIIGQTADLAPADRRLYATRDVTATVESMPLITASILSKKLAAGLQGLVIDVKCGNGAFVESPELAQALATSLVDVATGAKLRTTAIITDMNQVLGHSVGNALEVAEAITYLRGDRAALREPRLHEITMALGSEMLVLGGLAHDLSAARAQLQAALDSGAAAERFARMVAALGGPKDLMDRPGDYLTAAPVVLPVLAPCSGTLAAMQTRAVGLAVVELGGGRHQATDSIDPRVGLSHVQALGTRLSVGAPLAYVHAANAADAERARAQLLSACTIADISNPDAPWDAKPCILRTVTANHRNP